MSQSSNLNSFECTEDKLPKDGSSVEAGNLSTYQGLTKNGDHCLAYVKTKGGGSSASCAQYCEDIGSTCVGVWDQLSGTTCALDPINITVNHGATCHNRAGLRDMLCICDKPSPDNPFPGPSPGRVCGSAESFNEAVDLCKVCLPNAEFTDAPVAEQDKRLRSCVIDICSLPGTATLDDKEAIAENSCEQDPDLPPDGMKVCSAAGPLAYSETVSAGLRMSPYHSQRAHTTYIHATSFWVLEQLEVLRSHLRRQPRVPNHWRRLPRDQHNNASQEGLL